MWGCNWGGFWSAPGGWFLGGGLFGLLWKILLVALVVYLAVKLVETLRPGKGGRMDREDSLEILKIKFAKGEINAEEYQRMREVLAQ